MQKGATVVTCDVMEQMVGAPTDCHDITNVSKASLTWPELFRTDNIIMGYGLNYKKYLWASNPIKKIYTYVLRKWIYFISFEIKWIRHELSNSKARETIIYWIMIL